MKTLLAIIFLGLFPILSPSGVMSADLIPGSTCNPDDIVKGINRCVDSSPPTGYSYSCQPSSTVKGVYLCQRDVIGQVQAPAAIKALGIGSAGISKFLNNLITLIYMIASVVFVFMILWGAFEWLSSGGNKDNLDNARKRITQAIIGIILFGIAFAIMSLVGVFTGFTFFWDKSATGCGPTAIETTYFDDRPGINECIHKVYNKDCQAIFIKVEPRFCGK